jgi:tRNA-Thr(GGU) m(6)t(6)A37 methyltransferase TsaA
MASIVYMPIGYIYTPFKKTSGMPIQPAAARGIKGKIEIFPEFIEGIKDLDGFSHVMLLYHFHLVNDFDLQVTPFLDVKKRGVFATRAPCRPNSIGLSVVKLTSIHKNILSIEDIDVVDQTPLIDIKPFIPEIDIPEQSDKIQTGWYKKAGQKISEIKSDDRFIK